MPRPHRCPSHRRRTPPPHSLASHAACTLACQQSVRRRDAVAPELCDTLFCLAHRSPLLLFDQQLPLESDRDDHQRRALAYHPHDACRYLRAGDSPASADSSCAGLCEKECERERVFFETPLRLQCMEATLTKGEVIKKTRHEGSLGARLGSATRTRADENPPACAVERVTDIPRSMFLCRGQHFPRKSKIYKGLLSILESLAHQIPSYISANGV